MPSTKPIYMGVLLYNSTTSKYAGLYYKSEKTDGSAVAVNQFYWLETNNRGEILDYRTNMINGWFDSQNNAVNNKPSGYSDQVPIDLTDEFVVSFMPAWTTDGSFGFPYTIDGVVQTNNMYKYTLDSIGLMLDAGATNIVCPINFSTLYYSKAQFDMDTAGTDTNGINAIYSDTTKSNTDGFVKKVVDLIVAKGKKASISFRLEGFFVRESWNDNRQWNPRLINDSDLMVDNFGNYANGVYGRGSFSYASTNAKNVAVNYAKNILRRYKAYANDWGVKVHWCSIVTSQTSEAEYAYENNNSANALIQTLFDYSNISIIGFRTWLQSSTGGNYANIGALNTAWGSNFANFDSINKENVIGWNISDVITLNKIFASKKGKDWYNYSLYNYLNFFSAIKTAINSFVNDNASGGGIVKYMLESGADIQQFDQNSSSYRRMTFDQSKIQEVYDYHKCWNSFFPGATDNRNSWGAFQTDFARSNYVLYNKKQGTELYANDFVEQQGISQNTNDIFNAFKGVNTALIKNKIKEIMYIAPNRYKDNMVYQNESARLGIADAVSQIKTITTFEEPTKEVTFTINYLLENGIEAVYNLWKNNGGSTSTRINLHIGDTTSGGGGDTSGGGSTLTDKFYTIYQDSSGYYHEFSMNNKNFASNVDNIGSNNGGKKYYNFDENGNYTGTDGSLVDTHFQLILPCHSITNDGTTTSTLVRHKVEIFNGNGTLIWRNEQYKGFRKLSGVDSPLNNSHPSNAVGGAKPQYNQGDSTFFFPLGQNYKIKIYNWAGVFTARIDAVNVNTAVKYYEGKLNTDGILEFDINPSKITTSYIRGLKVILDRFPDTDTINTTNIMSQIAP